MSDETRRVLDLLAQGKITVDDAAELLKAMREAGTAPASSEPDPSSGSGSKPRYIRIAVRKQRGACDASGRAHVWPGFTATTGTNEVDIRVPMALVRSGIKLGAFVPGGADFLSKAFRERGIDADISKIDPDKLDALFREMGELTVDVDHGRAQVRITAE